MNTRHGDTIIHDPESAAGYDAQAHATEWSAPHVVFRLMHRYVRAGEGLLDLGIGSGLSSLPFHEAGLRIFGLDGSAEVLEVCRAKGFAQELLLRDLRDLPLPYQDAAFDDVIAVAVLNSFADLRPYVAEAARLIRGTGTLAFTVEDRKPGQGTGYAINRSEVNESPDPETAVWLYRHGRDEVTGILEQNGFLLLESEEFVGFRYPAEDRDVMFTAYVARRKGA